MRRSIQIRWADVESCVTARVRSSHVPVAVSVCALSLYCMEIFDYAADYVRFVSNRDRHATNINCSLEILRSPLTYTNTCTHTHTLGCASERMALERARARARSSSCYTNTNRFLYGSRVTRMMLAMIDDDVWHGRFVWMARYASHSIPFMCASDLVSQCSPINGIGNR